MRARAFNKRIEIWEKINVPDGFGGNTTSNVLVTTSWAKIDTFKSANKGSADTDLGLLSTQTGIIITLRKRNDIFYDSVTQFVMYRGNKYIISTSPTNIDFKDNIIQFVGVREQVDQNADLSDLAKQAIAEDLALQHMIRVNIDGGTVTDFDCLVAQIKNLL
jgi:head-tail adaptor